MSSIMIVDDEPSLRAILRVQLELDKHEVVEAKDGVEAYTLFQERPVDVVISDLNMPKMGGEELVGKIRLHNPSTGIIILTAYGSLESAQRVICQGCDEYLLKPLEDLNLVSFAVYRCLQRRKLLENFIFSKRANKVKSDLIHNVADLLAHPASNLKEAVESVCQAIDDGEIKEARLLSAALFLKVDTICDIVAEIIEHSDRLKSLEIDEKKEQ